MENGLLVTIGIIIAGFVVLAIFVRKWIVEIQEKNKPSEDLLEVIKILRSDSKEDRKVLLESLQKNTQSLNERLDNAARVIAGVQRNLGEMSEIGRSMKDLQEFLRSPKLRGNIGEQVLKELLSQILPPKSFSLQYSFKSGNIVDAVIRTSNGLISIDSKFPLENFRRYTQAEKETDKDFNKKEFIKDVKKHVSDISRKYILSEEGTVDYALMYIPSEAVYYEIVNNSSLFDYCSSCKILPVSPTTFYAYLRAILVSFEGQKIEARAKQILSAIYSIKKDYSKVEENLSTLGKHITNSYNMMSQTITSFTRLGQKISTTSQIGEIKEEQKKLVE